MFELIALAVAGATGVVGHIRSRRFVGRRLRYTKLVEIPALGVWIGVGAAVLAAPVVALLPVVGAGTAIALGAGVGTGTALGARDAKGPPLLEE